MGMRRERDCQS